MIFSKTFTFKTSLTANQVLKKLTDVSDNTFQIYINGIIIRDTKLFSGDLTKDSFIIKKNLPYFNSFRPIIEGKLSQSGTTTQLTLKFKIKWWVLLFVFLFLGIGTLIFIMTSSLFKLLANGTGHYPPLWIAPFIDIAFISIIILFFQLETKWGLADLKKILELKEV